MITKTTFITSLKDGIGRPILRWSGTTPELIERLIMWKKGSETIIKSIVSLTIPVGMLS